MSRTPTGSRTRTAALLGSLLLAPGLVLAGCSSGGDEEAGSAGDSADSAAMEVDRDQALLDSPAKRTAGDGVAAEPDGVAAPAVIQTGTMTVESDDVAAARFDLGKVVDARGGSIADEKTTASAEGTVRLSRVVLRVPSEEFDATLTDLAELGEVTASTRKAEDVTGEVIDTRARIRAQEQSLARVEVLFGRAQDIRDIVAIEAQLSRRQAELDSLTGQLAWLEDQTSLSTITVYLERAPEDRAAVAADDSAFVAGLKHGWHALTALGGGLATVAGALLPFAVVALVLGVPVAVLLRRWLARRPLRRPATEA